MKKLFLFLPLLIFIFSFKVNAASQADVEKMQQMYNEKFNATLNASVAGQIVDKWQTTNETYCIMGQYDIYFTNSVNTSGGNFAFTWQYKSTNYSPGFSGTLTWNSSGGSLTLNQNYFLNYGTWDSFHTIPIDWDTVYYSANILPPDLNITYRELSSVPVVEVPVNVNLVAAPQNVFVEIDAVFFCPEEVSAWSDNGIYTYNTLDTVGFYMPIIEKEDLVLATNASNSYIHLALNDAWNEVYDTIPMSEITWHTDPNYSSALVNKMKSRFENIRKVCCFYGNELQLFVRYFVINNDTEFVVGSWRVWYSKTPNTYTDQTPTWYQPYIQASGTTGTSSNTGSNTQQDPDVITIPPGSGDPTGIYYSPSNNITVGSNVPNYPDYPTIRSYNADNFLVQTMNYLDYLNNEESEKTLFGEFGHFLASLFVFIPGEIWTIIAVGFSLVIVVMFLKIL